MRTKLFNALELTGRLLSIEEEFEESMIRDDVSAIFDGSIPAALGPNDVAPSKILDVEIVPLLLRKRGLLTERCTQPRMFQGNLVMRDFLGIDVLPCEPKILGRRWENHVADAGLGQNSYETFSGVLVKADPQPSIPVPLEEGESLHSTCPLVSYVLADELTQRCEAGGGSQGRRDPGGVGPVSKLFCCPNEPGDPFLAYVGGAGPVVG